jgi:hypothetical protein
MAKHGVILFHTTSAAFAAEKAVNKAGFKCSLVPTPREASSDCGVALRVDQTASDDVLRLLDEADVELAGTHPPRLS